MFEKIKQFLDNNDFHNPVTDKNGSLLSTKENIKGRVLPGLAQIGILATTLAFYSATAAGGLSSLMSLGNILVPLALAAIPEIAYRRRYQRSLATLPHFDLNTDEGMKSFCKHHPNHGEAFVSDYVKLSKELSFKKAPEIFTDENHFAASAGLSSLLPGKKPYLLIGNSLLENSDAPSRNGLLALCAHELGHIKQKYYEKDIPFRLRGMINFCLGLNMVMNAGTVFCAEAAYLLVSGLASHIAHKKHDQYSEREADRVSLMTTGLAEESKVLYAKYMSDRNIDIYEPKKLSDRFLRARSGMTDRHPLIISRAVYAGTFAQENPEYCEKTRARYKTAAETKAPAAV